MRSTHVSPMSRGAIVSRKTGNARRRELCGGCIRRSPVVSRPSREQHDARQVARPQLGARLMQRLLEVGGLAAQVRTPCDRSDPWPPARAGPRVDSITCTLAPNATMREWSGRSSPLSGSMRAGRVADRLARDAVGHVNQIHDRQRRGAERNHRPRERQRQRREQQRADGRLQQSAAAIEVGPVEAQREPHQRQQRPAATTRPEPSS